MDEKKREELLKKIEEYDEIIKLDPNNAPYYNGRGNTYYKLKEYKKAKENYDEAVKLNPKNSSYYNNRGNTFSILKEYEKALNDYSRAIELNLNNASYYNNRGIAYSNLEEYEKAVNDYSRAIELNPKNSSYYYNRGIAYSNLKEYEKAVNDYSRAIELNPKNSSYYYNRGIAYSNLKEYKKAVNDYSRAIELNPNNASYYNNRGIGYYSLKDYEKAIKNCNKAIELDPNNNSIKETKNLILKLNKNIQYDNKIADTTKNIEEINREDFKSNIIHNFSDDLTSNFNKIFQEVFNNTLDLHLNAKCDEDFEIVEEKFSSFINKYKDSQNKSPELENLLEEAELYRKASKEKVKRLKGYLIFSDILGWKGVWKKFSLTEEKMGVVNRLLNIRNELENEIKSPNSICSMNLISDTFIIYSQSFEMSKNLSKKLMTLCLEKELPIRGAISYGECYNRDTVYVGPAVDEAASWHDEGEEIGIFYTPSAKQEIIKNKYNLPEDFIKLKSGEIKTFFINWYNKETKKKFDELFSKIDKSSIKVYLKYLNTEKKFDKYLKEEKEEMLRIGNGYDVHRLVEGRKLMLGGVEVPHTKGVLGHSDGDVLLHAITDAIIGALGLGDIGLHFPDNDENLKDIDSAILLKKINNIMKEKNYKIVNLDSIIVIQKPKLRPYIDSIRDNIAKILEIDSELINVKAKTEEKLGFTGDETGVKSYCVVLLEKEKC